MTHFTSDEITAASIISTKTYYNDFVNKQLFFIIQSIQHMIIVSVNIIIAQCDVMEMN